MKKISVWLIVAIVLLVVTVAFAGTASIFNRESNNNSAQTTLYSASTGTTAATDTNIATFDYPMNNLSCDLYITPYSAGVLTYTITGNNGTSTTSFPATPSLVTTATLSPTSATNNLAVATKTGVAFRVLKATITAPTTTAVVTVNCSATK